MGSNSKIDTYYKIMLMYLSVYLESNIFIPFNYLYLHFTVAISKHVNLIFY